MVTSSNRGGAGAASAMGIAAAGGGAERLQAATANRTAGTMPAAIRDSRSMPVR